MNNRKGHKNLTYTQRVKIETLMNAKVDKKDIASAVGIGLRTLYYELKRGAYKKLNGSTWDYYTSYGADVAQQRYNNLCTGKGRPLKVGNDFEFVRYVENRVKKDKISACAVLGQIKHDKLNFKTSISKTTLYRYIQIGIFSNLKLGKRKQKTYRKVIKRAPKGTSIEKRPIDIKERKTFGHWEMDCVCGSTKASLLVLSERLTRKEIIFKMENQKAQSVVQCLNKLERRFGSWILFQTLMISYSVDIHMDCYFRESIKAGRPLTITECDQKGIEIRYLKQVMTPALFEKVTHKTAFGDIPKAVSKYA